MSEPVSPSLSKVSSVIRRPAGVGAFEFVILATLRAAQLMRGCTPRLDGVHKATVMALREVSAGKVSQDIALDVLAPAAVETAASA